MFSSNLFKKLLVVVVLAALWVSSLPVSGGWLPIAESVATPISNACSTSSGTTVTFTAQGTGGTNPNRITVVTINWDDSTNAGTAQLTAMTVGGISMSRAASAVSGVTNSNSEIWYVANPSGTTANIVATFATAVNGVTIEVYSLIGFVTAPIANTIGTTTVSQTYNNKQLALAAGSRQINVSTSLSNMVNDFSSACGTNLWGVHASQKLSGNGQTLTTTISPTSNTPLIALAVWSSVPLTPLSPTGLTGLIAWYDTKVTASMTLSGSNVTAMADQSGTGSNLGSFGGTVVYSATAFNTSYPGLQFINGNNGVLEGSSFPMGTGNTLTAWYVGTLGTGGASASPRILSYCISSGSVFDFNDPGCWVLGTGSPFTSVNLNRNGVIINPTGLTASPAGHVVIITINSSGVMTVYVDGIASTTATSAGNWRNTGFFDLGRQAAHASDFWYGIIAEAGVATGFSDAATVARLYAYEKNKWGL